MTRLLLSLQTALKALRSTPTLSLLAIGMLATGIGATTTVFSLADQILLRPIDFGRNTGRVLSLNAIHPDKPLDLEEQQLSWPELREARTATSLELVEGLVYRSFDAWFCGTIRRYSGASSSSSNPCNGGSR